MTMLARALNQLSRLLIALTSGCGARLLDLGHDTSSDGSTSLVIASHQGGAGALAMGNGRLFWAALRDTAGVVRSCDVENCQATIVNHMMTAQATRFFGVNRTNIYW